jgi:cbb3-type cytochrome oxidase subunit 1
VLFLTGGLIMAYNLIRTARGEIRTEEAMVIEAPRRPRPVPAE